MVLLSVALIKYYEEDLITAKRLVDFSRIIESKKITKINVIFNSIKALKESYFE